MRAFEEATLNAGKEYLKSLAELVAEIVDDSQNSQRTREVLISVFFRVLLQHIDADWLQNNLQLCVTERKLEKTIAGRD